MENTNTLSAVTLKTLTWDSHKRAESTQLMQQLLKNQISPELYCDYLYVKYCIFRTIEERIVFLESDLPRANNAFLDWQEMSRSMPPALSSIEEYMTHLREVSADQLWAHVYVQYLAPLYGGQLIRKIIGEHFPTRHLQFTAPGQCIAEVRSHETLDLADEANIAFERTMKIYEDLYNSHQSNS